MRAVGIGGSPRKNSNTEFYLKVVLETLEEKGIDTDLILLSDKTIYPCDGDYRCWETESDECELRGDDFHEVYRKMIAADAIIVGSPIHYAAPHPKLWSLLVRAGFPHARGIYAQVVQGRVTKSGRYKSSPFLGR